MKTVKGTPQEPIQYKASITREQFMFYEMRTTAKLLMEGLTDAEAVKRIISENLFQYPTEKQIRSQALACIKRLHGMNDESLVDDLDPAFRYCQAGMSVCDDEVQPPGLGFHGNGDR